MTDRTKREPPQRQRKHPDPYESDLNPGYMAGQNIGERLPTAAASELKDVIALIGDHFTMDELRQIPILVRGARLEQGGTYVDLTDDDRREFTATGGMSAGADQRLVPKSETPPPYWNRLIRAEHDVRRK